MNAVERFYYEMSEPYRQALDGLSLGSVLAGLFGLLPDILTGLSTILAIVWMAIRIYETDTVKSWLRRRRR